MLCYCVFWLTLAVFSHAAVLLDEDFVISTTPLDDDVEITVAAKTRGFFGLGFTMDGRINGADLVIGWIDDITGKAFIIDGHGTEGERPKQDTVQSYHVIDFEQNATHTLMKFSRKYDTCDQGDVVVVNDTMRVIWAIGDTDPTSPPWEGIRWRGPQSIHIANPPLPKNPNDKIFWDVLAQDFTLPDHTVSFYWCKIYKIPSLDSKHHIIGYLPMIQKGHENLIEHMILYECLGGSEFEIYGSHPGASCHDSMTPKDWNNCSTPIITWATGSRGEFLPQHVGLPMAEGDGKATYYMLEIHYDNPALQRVRDSSGLRVYYTPNLRKFDSSNLIVGVTPSSVQLIPPKQLKFKNTGYCDSQCTNLMFPENGIKIISVTFHTHSAGRQVKLRHIREGKEIGIIAEDNNFDPSFQQSKRLLKEAIILPGDDLLTECTYSTKNRTRLTLGGYSIKEETCLAYLLYYPRTAFSSCTSITPVDVFFKTFGISEFYDYEIEKLENLILESEKQVQKIVRPAVPMQSLFFRFSNQSFNIDAKQSESLLKAMTEINIDKMDNENSIFSKLYIYLPEEFQNKSMLGHLKDLPWQEKVFTMRVEEMLNKGKHKTFCRLQNNLPAMPSRIYSYPNFTSEIQPVRPSCKSYFVEETNSSKNLKFNFLTLLVIILMTN